MTEVTIKPIKTKKGKKLFVVATINKFITKSGKSLKFLQYQGRYKHRIDAETKKAMLERRR